MKDIGRAFLALIGAGIGFWVGVVLGFVVPFLTCNLIDTTTGSQLGQIGWVALFATIPGGAVLGFALGGICIITRPRLFLLTFLPLFVFFVAAQIADDALRNEHRPRTFVLKVSGYKGNKFVGLVRSDDEIHKIEGTFPAEFVYQSRNVEFAVALLDPKPAATIAVELFIDGKGGAGRRHDYRIDTPEDKLKWPLKQQIEDGDIIAAEYKSFGYSEWFGGTAYYGGSVLKEDVARLRK